MWYRLLSLLYKQFRERVICVFAKKNRERKSEQLVHTYLLFYTVAPKLEHRRNQLLRSFKFTHKEFNV